MCSNQAQFAHEKVREILQAMPGRGKQVGQLLALLGQPGHLASSSIFVYGHPSTGKTLLVSSLLKGLNVPHAWVNCIEAYTPTLLYQSVLNQLAQMEPSVENNFAPYTYCDNMCDFVRELQDIIREKWRPDSTTCIVLDFSERLRNADPTILAAFLRLQELVKMNICVILISQIVWEKFRCQICYYEPHQIHCPSYTNDEIVEIMSRDCPPGHSQEFYVHYVKLVLSVFYLATKNICELRHMAKVNFPKYCLPIEDGRAKETDVHKLWRNIEPYLKESLLSIYLRDISSSKWPLQCSTVSVEAVKALEGTTKLEAKHPTVELPFYSKFLLLAAYLASYNPPKTDKKFFVKERAPRTRTTKTKTTQLSNHHLGPKPFPLNRMLAIFNSIVEEGVPRTAMIFAQISTLVSLKLLDRVTGDMLLASPKYKCLVGLDFICSIARTVGFDIVGYLNDFN